MEIEGPDGHVFEFPDGTAQEVISRTVRNHYARPRNLETNDTLGRAAAYSHGGTFGLGDEIVGAFGGAGEALREAFAPDPQRSNVVLNVPGEGIEGRFRRIGEGARRGYDQTRGRYLDDLEQYRARRPTEAAAVEIVGGVASPANPAITQAARALPFGAQIARAANTGRGLPRFAAQAAQAGTIGALAGSAYGFNTGENLESRVENASQLGLFGAGFGAATPAAVNLARPVVAPIVRGVGNWADDVVRSAMQGQTNAVVGLPMGGGARPSPPRIPRNAINTIDRLAQDTRQTPADVEGRLAAARADPQGQVLADVFGAPGRQRVRSMVNFPGETAQRATDTARARYRAAPGRIETALRSALNAGESRSQAMNRLESVYRGETAQAYNQHWQPMAPRQRQLYEERIAPLLAEDNPNEPLRRLMTRAVRSAREQFGLDLANGHVTGSFDDNLPRALHYIKQGIGAQAQWEASPLRGASGQRIAGIRQLYRQFSDLLDPAGGEAIIPGYRATTQTAGDYFTAREALEAGADMLRARPEEVARQFQSLSPFERHYRRIGLVDEIVNTTRGGTNRNVNVARLLDDPNMRGVIAAAFDDPQQAARFLAGLDEQYRLMENASTWTGGSSTAANLQHQEENAAEAVIDGAANLALGNPAQAARSVARRAQDAITLGVTRRANNQRGEALLSRVDTPESEDFANAVIAELRRLEAERVAASELARRGAAASGQAERGQ